MKHLKLKAQKRTVKGNDLRKLRKENFIPAVLFGKTYGSDPIQVVYSDFFQVYKEAGKNHVIELQIENKDYPCIIHDIDIHPYKNFPRHVDFLSVDFNTKITARVPVVITGEAIGVKEQGAVLIVDLEEVEVKSLPDSIPNEILVDVTHLKSVGDTIHVKDLPVDSSFEYLTEDIQSVVTLVAQSKENDFATNEIEDDLSPDINSGSDSSSSEEGTTTSHK